MKFASQHVSRHGWVAFYRVFKLLLTESLKFSKPLFPQPPLSMIPVRACPVVITNSDDEGTILLKRREQCGPCKRCGLSNYIDGSLKYGDWGAGCVRECSQLLCSQGMVWDSMHLHPQRVLSITSLWAPVVVACLILCSPLLVESMKALFQL